MNAETQTPLYPWQHTDWQQVTREFDALPNAWLLTGPAGIGKAQFARTLAQALLCETSRDDRLPCGICQACHWFAGGNHPDYRLLTPDMGDEDNAKTPTRKLPVIKVEAVREVIEFAHLSAHRSGRRVVVIDPAEAMNTQSANALLKILEEPPPGVLFILVSHNRERLLPTIKSRCRQFPLSTPSPQQALGWLEQQGMEHAAAELAHHGGSPLFEHDPTLHTLRRQFIDMLQQPGLMRALQLAEQIDRQKLPLAVPLDWLGKWLTDLAALKLARMIRYHPEDEAALHELAGRINTQMLFACYDKVQQLMPFGQHTLNVRLQLEALLIEYLRLFSKQRN